jgi:hypothetical protein
LKKLLDMKIHMRHKKILGLNFLGNLTIQEVFMKIKSCVTFCLLVLSFACDRVTMEKSPEALVAYGRPSQHSNSDPVNEKNKDMAGSTLPWMGSSAIEPKPRVDY